MGQSPRVAVATIVLAASLLVGCATMKPMGFSEPIAGLPQSRDAVAFFSVRTANQNKTGYQPNVSHVFVWEDGKDKREKYSFKVEGPYRQGKDEFNEYLISLRLPAGRPYSEALRPAGCSRSAVPSARRCTCVRAVARQHRLPRPYRRDHPGDGGVSCFGIVPLIDQTVAALRRHLRIRISDNCRATSGVR
jgi:hypothetical protein